MEAINGSPHYKTTQNFRKAVKDRINQQVKAGNLTFNQVNREFLYQRFLALIFSSSDSPWILKGGGGLLASLQRARFSEDLDLLHTGSLSPAQAITQLRILTMPRPGDLMRFEVSDHYVESRVNPVVTTTVDAFIGGYYDRFKIDIARELQLVGTPENIKPHPVVEIPGLPELPAFTIYPLGDQISDKVCAMYKSRPHGAISTRYHDLIDLSLLVTTSHINARSVRDALEAEKRRSNIQLPHRLQSPGPQWVSGYARTAQLVKLTDAAPTLHAALELVGACLNPLLDGSRTSGIWEPGLGWTEENDQ
jgi:predicted nucleotidyltransferase component of viral defense system